jgi:hypothetical protein
MWEGPEMLIRLTLDVECEVLDLGPVVCPEDALELSVLRVCSRLARGELSINEDADVVDGLGAVIGAAYLSET